MSTNKSIGKKRFGVRNSCCGNGAFISVRVLPYGSSVRRRSRVSRSVKGITKLMA